MNLRALQNCLRELGWEYSLLQRADGGMIVALERGARVLGIYPDPEGDNLVWVCPDLANAGLARAKYDLGAHWNTGGERTWLSPEVEFHIPDLNEVPIPYTVQTGIDPGHYHFVKQDSSAHTIVWRQEGAADAFRSGDQIRFQLSKSCKLVEDPLRVARVNIENPNYSFVGYEMETTIEALEAEAWFPAVALWTIIQVPACGTALVPTYGVANPTDFFAPTGSSHLEVSQGQLRFQIDAKETHKISLKSVQTTGRFGYFRRGADGTCHLLVRQISVQPYGDYRDTPWKALDDRGHCIQFYNDNGTIGDFGELEHHSPVMMPSSFIPAHLKRTDTSQVWGYSGSERLISTISHLLLGM